MVSIDPTAAPGAASAPARAHPFYFAAWRWHFYAGLYVIPFLMMLAVTGLIMLWTSALTGRDGEWIAVTPQATALPVSAQAQAALAAVPDSTLQGYIAPRAADLAAIVRLGLGEDSVMVAVDPYTAQVLAQFPRRQGLYDIADTIHGTLYLDTLGDRLIEIAAALALPFSAPLFAREAHGVRPRRPRRRKRPPTPSRSPTASPGRPVLERRSLAASW